MKKLSGTLMILGLTAATSLILRRLQPTADLTDKTALIVGGSRGLGLLLAREFGRAGCRVAICARNEAGLKQAADQLAAWGIQDVVTLPCDAGNLSQVERLVTTVTAKLGHVDILVNNAGVIQAGPLASLTLDDFENTMKTMFWGPVYTTMQLLPEMMARNTGHIVNVTSIGGKVAVPHLLPYVCAKFAATGFSEGLTTELAGTNVRVTTVIPGLMRTGSYLNAYFKGQHKAEFLWFGLSANLPFTSMDAERASRQIVTAVKRGQSEVILSLPAKLLARFYGLFPGIAIRILGLANRLILPEGANPAKMRGMTLEETAQSPLFDFLTAWGQSAARRFNQYRVTNPSDEASKPEPVI